METDRLVRKAGKTFTTWRPWLSIKPSANLAGLLALPCRIAEFSCVPPHNEEEKTVDPDELSTTNTKLLNNYFWQMVIYVLTNFSSAFELCGCIFTGDPSVTMQLPWGGGQTGHHHAKPKQHSEGRDEKRKEDKRKGHSLFSCRSQTRGYSVYRPMGSKDVEEKEGKGT